VYRILRPNGQWIIDERWPEHLRFKDLEAAVTYAQQFARATEDYGEYLIFEGWNDEPSAQARMLNLFEEDE
jgi:hypothetical protein